MLKIGDNILRDTNLMIFFMEKVSTINFSVNHEENGIKFIISIYENNHILVVETENNIIIEDNDISKFYDLGQKFLDMVLFKKGKAYFVNHSESYIYRNIINGKENIKVVENMSLKMTATFNDVVLGKDGNIIDNEKDLSLEAYDFYRYFRTSIKTNYLIDAYRYLYLSYESVMHSIITKTNSEKKWIEEVFKKLNNDYKIDNEFNKNMYNHFYYNHYKKYRNKLFHSKDDIIKPFDYLEMKGLYKAFIDLNEICKFVFSKKCDEKYGGGLIISEYGFRSMYDSLKAMKIDKIILEEQGIKIPVNIADDTFDNTEMKISRVYQAVNIKEMIFKKISFGNEKYLQLITSKFEEEIKIKNINKIEFEIIINSLNKSVFDRRFKDYYLF
ncbi:hypothetical protein M0P25_05110 [archaeon]|jgi:hypothetical protein|nr:hypothetical protein [archaeon]